MLVINHCRLVIGGTGNQNSHAEDQTQLENPTEPELDIF